MRVAAAVIQTQWRAMTEARKQRAGFTAMRLAAIKLQMRWRAKLECSRQRNYYMRLYSSTLLIQRRWRATVEGRKQRENFQSVRVAAIAIQRQWRAVVAAREQRKRCQRLCYAAVVIQRHWRATIEARKQSERYGNMRSAAISLQRQWRARLESRQQRGSYTRLRSSVLVVQRRWRALVKGREQREKYQNIRSAAVVLQRHWRAKMDSSRQRNEFLRLRSATVVIQRRWRSLVEGRKQLIAYRKLCRAVLLLQAECRGWIVRRKIEAQVQSVTRLQAVVRGFLVRRQILQMRLDRRAERLNELKVQIRQQQAAVCIQRAFRKRQFVLHVKYNITSLISIQRWVRSRLTRIRYLRLRNTIERLQYSCRCWLVRRQVAAVTIQSVVRTWLVHRQLGRMHRAATVIQARWRAMVVRRQVSDKKVLEARKKVIEANRNVKEENKLCNRTSTALDFLLAYRQLSHVLEALINLEVVSRLSPQCCQRMVEGNAINVLFKLMRSCNRSLPHMELIKHSICILLNLSKYSVTSSAVFQANDSVECLVELLQIYREKGQIFTDTCMLLGIMGLNADQRQAILSKPAVVDKLRSIHTLTLRKHQMDQKRLSTKNKIAAMSSYPPHASGSHQQQQQHKIGPVWLMRRDTVHSMDDPMTAVNFMISSLNIPTKAL